MNKNPVRETLDKLAKKHPDDFNNPHVMRIIEVGLARKWCLQTILFEIARFKVKNKIIEKPQKLPLFGKETLMIENFMA